MVFKVPSSIYAEDECKQNGTKMLPGLGKQYKDTTATQSRQMKQGYKNAKLVK